MKYHLVTARLGQPDVAEPFDTEHELRAAWLASRAAWLAARKELSTWLGTETCQTMLAAEASSMMSRAGLNVTPEDVQGFLRKFDGRKPFQEVLARFFAGPIGARAQRLCGDHMTRERCAWSAHGHFMDRTNAYRVEVEALVAELTATAPPGYSAAVEPAGLMSWRVRFEGSPTGTHSLQLMVSEPERILSHWNGYRPAPVDLSGKAG